MIANREINFYAPTGTMWHQDVSQNHMYRDRYNVWIVLIEDGRRYFKHVQITGAERDRGETMLHLFKVMQDCWTAGPLGMTEVNDGDQLPYEEVVL